MTNASLESLVTAHNRRILGEAILTLGVGVGSCLVIFGVMYWLWFIAFTMCLRGLAYGGPWVMAGLVTGVFFLAGVWGAWRQSDPIAEADIVVDDSPGRVLEDVIGFSMGVPIIRRESIAGAAALLIGGPANIFDAISIWRSRLPASGALIAEAESLLKSCATGVDPQQVRTPAAIALLYRMHLIKTVQQPGGGLLLQQTQKGMEATATSTVRQPPRAR